MTTPRTSPTGTSPTETSPTETSPPGAAEGRLESDYYRFMNFDSAANKEGRRHYLQFFDRGPVLELACGRGEFLALLGEAGLDGYGVDSDEGMVSHGTGQGVRVVLGDALDHLAEQPAASLGGVFCAHFLEHLPAPQVDQVYAETGRVLVPGGTFVAAVPNAACLSVLGYDFWRDPTHVRFYDPLVLSFFADRAGLETIESGGNPNNHAGPPPHLYPPELSDYPMIAEQLGKVITRAQRLYPAPRRRPHRRVGSRAKINRAEGNGAALSRHELWVQLEHLIAMLDRQLQVNQHQFGEMRAAYLRLLGQLYPANEVYLVARKPIPEEDHAEVPDADTPDTDGPDADGPAGQ